MKMYNKRVQRPVGKLKLLLTVLCVTAFTGSGALAAPIDDGRASIDESIESVAQTALNDRQIVGAAIAVVQSDGSQIQQTYGRSNALTGSPLTVDTPIQAASLGKPVTAYALLQLAGDGQVDLDAPVSRYLGETWTQQEQARAITLRQLLNHSSGLSNSVMGGAGEASFEPGTDFSYSGEGFIIAQRVIESVTGVHFDEAMERLVFAPLGMTNSQFGKAENNADRPKAFGHAPALPVLGVALGLTLILTLAACFLWRLGVGLLKKNWAWPTARLTLGAWVIALAAISAVGIMAGGMQLGASVVGQIAATGLVLAAVTALIYLGLRRLKDTGFWLPAAMIAAGLIAVAVLSGRQIVLAPVTPVEGNAAFSLTTTLPDYTKFISSLSGHGESDAPSELLAPDVTVSQDVSWTLGLGHTIDERGSAVWQWGANPGFGGFMLVYPETGEGLVVLVNSHGGDAFGRRVAHTLFGVETAWALPGNAN